MTIEVITATSPGNKGIAVDSSGYYVVGGETIVFHADSFSVDSVANGILFTLTAVVPSFTYAATHVIPDEFIA